MGTLYIPADEPETCNRALEFLFRQCKRNMVIKFRSCGDLRPGIMQHQSVDQGEKGGAKPTSRVAHIPSGNQLFHIRSPRGL